MHVCIQTYQQCHRGQSFHVVKLLMLAHFDYKTSCPKVVILSGPLLEIKSLAVYWLCTYVFTWICLAVETLLLYLGDHQASLFVLVLLACLSCRSQEPNVVFFFLPEMGAEKWREELSFVWSHGARFILSSILLCICQGWSQSCLHWA